MKGFIDFIRQQGVVGLAVGFLLGGAVSKVVTAFVNDLINPLIGLIFSAADLDEAVLKVGKVTFLWGNFVSTLVDFLVVALVVYFGIRFLGLKEIKKKS